MAVLGVQWICHVTVEDKKAQDYLGCVPAIYYPFKQYNACMITFGNLKFLVKYVLSLMMVNPPNKGVLLNNFEAIGPFTGSSKFPWEVARFLQG